MYVDGRHHDSTTSQSHNDMIGLSHSILASGNLDGGHNPHDYLDHEDT